MRKKHDLEYSDFGRKDEPIDRAKRREGSRIQWQKRNVQE